MKDFERLGSDDAFKANLAKNDYGLTLFYGAEADLIMGDNGYKKVNVQRIKETEVEINSFDIGDRDGMAVKTKNVEVLSNKVSYDKPENINKAYGIVREEFTNGDVKINTNKFYIKTSPNAQIESSSKNMTSNKVSLINSIINVLFD